MSALYLWLKAVHVLFAAVWIGGATAVLGMTSLMLRTTDRQRLAVLASACEFTGLRLIAPFGGLAFLVGLITMAVGHVPMQFWIWVGVVTGLLVLSIGGAVLGRGFRRLIDLLQTPGGNDAEVSALLGRLRAIGASLILLLVIAVVVMVLKPA
jgi:uncharacterized membrane protein